MARKFEPVKGAPEGTQMPTRKTKGSAGYDFYLPCDVTLQPYSYSEIIQTGVKCKLNAGEVLLLYIRSSIGLLKHVQLANSVGVIDCDYYGNEENDGNIGLVLQNNSGKIVHFKRGERIMQGIITKFYTVENDMTTGERKGGTGSTGR